MKYQCKNCLKEFDSLQKLLLHIDNYDYIDFKNSLLIIDNKFDHINFHNGSDANNGRGKS